MSCAGQAIALRIGERCLFRVSCEGQAPRATDKPTLSFLCKPNHTIHVKTNVKKIRIQKGGRVLNALFHDTTLDF